ncbi:RagB/SusD family nutrient uptake outer membrane protein [Flavivirga amylovorans]|uniref:RagB/SusD family nutrient uptake outer membrane protein n=1 Tax=Flavivirga amylovorans TaxID=870486 RepID=A0ABT8X0Q7_9FLAO|nr:RagB/SusD family nutrient uptake outer membrane protein [Flavivirga amylovorans]MDO5987536.1 RagB/SusD family nutrient uptake outer membrane protein [Flavivirga amylovorans]
MRNRFIYCFENITLLFILNITFFGCEDYIEIDPPQTEIVSEIIFSDDISATFAMNGVYVLMRNNDAIFNSGLEIFTGLTSDELNNESSSIIDYIEFNANEIQPDNTSIFNRFWQNAYQIINNANGIIEGVIDNDQLTPEVRDQLLGEALFIRAYTHFYLVNLFDEVPFVETTDLEVNANTSKQSVTNIYNRLIEDLIQAKTLMADGFEFAGGTRVRANKDAATALLARIYLYTENWVLAEQNATQVINTGLFGLETDLNNVFIATSNEAIWQLGSEDDGQTRLGLIFPITIFGAGNFVNLGATSLTDEFLMAFEENDLRFQNWIGANSSNQSYPVKYKNSTSLSIGNTGIPENIILLRLAEQYLIRAEALAQQNDITGAQADINAIRNRAGLSDTTANTQQTILDAIMQERRIELFAEGGHRWLDLIRTEKATEVLSPLKPLWDNTDVFWPIPEIELLNNSNLEPQNPGY